MTPASYRSSALAENVVAFSISYQHDNMLARGMGLEHLRELLIRLARLLVRAGANLAYGGNWKDTDDNFIFPLLQLISAEQEDSSVTAGSGVPVGKLYNHSPWPWYLDITPKIEAQWINCCSVVRITQQMAGFSEAEIVPDAKADDVDPRTLFNKAVTLSAMRRLMMEPMSIDVPDVGWAVPIPPVTARILLGGKVDSYVGFLPGIFEEALATLQQNRAVYILGGFGGAAEVLANAMLASGNDRPDELTLDWHRKQNPGLVTLLDGAGQFAVRDSLKGFEKSLDSLFAFVKKARDDLPGTLRTGLNDQDTRELMKTSNIGNAVHLVHQGLTSGKGQPALPV